MGLLALAIVEVYVLGEVLGYVPVEVPYDLIPILILHQSLLSRNPDLHPVPVLGHSFLLYELDHDLLPLVDLLCPFALGLECLIEDLEGLFIVLVIGERKTAFVGVFV